MSDKEIKIQIDIEQNKTPLLRFRAYKEAWERFKLGDVLAVKSGKDYKHLDAGEIPVYGTGGYMTSVNDKLSSFDAVGIGRKGTIDKPQLLKAPFWTVDTLFYMTPRRHNNLYYIYALASKIKWKLYDESTGVPSLSKVNIEKIVEMFPKSSEQIKIGSFFREMDSIIALYQRELELLQLEKQTLLSKMFPEEGETIPKVRFNGFTEDWEQRKVKQICSISTGKSNTQDKIDSGKYPFYVRSPIIEHSKEYLYDEEAVLTIGDGVGTGKVYHYVNGKYNLHQRVYRMFNFDSNILAKYFFYYFSKFFYQRVMSMTAKTSVDSVRLEMIADMNILLPTKEEQEKILVFFDELEDTIKLLQRKLETITEMKKTLLKYMFI